MSFPSNIDDEETGPGKTLPAWYVTGWTWQNRESTNVPAPTVSGTGSFPSDQVFVTLQQQYFDMDANSLSGYVTVWPSESFTIIEGTNNWRILQRLVGTETWPGLDSGTGPWAFSMEGSGKIFIWGGLLVVKLFATDNASIVTDSGNPLTYHVVEHFLGGQEFDITVPMATDSSVTSLRQLMVGGSAFSYKYDPVSPLGNLMPPVAPTFVSGPTPLFITGGTMTGDLNLAVVQLTDAATIAVDATKGNDFRITLGGNRILGNPSNPVDGQRIIVQVTQDATGGRTLTYGSAYEFSEDLPAPTLSSAPGSTDLLGFAYNAAKGKWLFAAYVPGFS